MQKNPDVAIVGGANGQRFQSTITTAHANNDTVNKTVTYWNNTEYKTITATFRDNLKVVLGKTLTSINFKGIVIKETYGLPRRLLEESRNYITFNNSSGSDIDNWEALRAEAINALNQRDPKFGFINYMVQLNVITLIHEDQVKDNKHIYVDSKDIVFSINKPDDAPDHPFSDSDKTLENYKRIINSKVSYIIGIDIVDNSDTIGSRWVYMADEAVKISPRKTNDKQEGIYIFSNSIDKDTMENVYYNLNNVDNTILYKTKEEALTQGNPGLLEKKKISKLEKKLKKEKAELELERTRRQNEAKEMELEHNRKLAKINTTKDTIKLIGAIAVAGIGAYAAFLKFRAATK
jgi:hypothetical protein